VGQLVYLLAMVAMAVDVFPGIFFFYQFNSGCGFRTPFIVGTS
jgi:hypothetical protein